MAGQPGTAIISDCGRYRYRLTRVVGDSDKWCLFIMLNPSTATAMQDDPTIRRCMAYARRWGCGKLIVVNLFAIRATNPKEMKAANDPVGPDNIYHVKQAASEVAAPIGRFWHEPGPVVCAWGNHGVYMDQGAVALGWINARKSVVPMCLKVNARSGQPAHPLYLRADLKPRRFGATGE